MTRKTVEYPELFDRPGRQRRSTTFVIPPDLLMKINVLASLKGQANSDLVVEAVREFIAKPEMQRFIKAELQMLVTAD
jgi:predicted transcriptional regulator